MFCESFYIAFSVVFIYLRLFGSVRACSAKAGFSVCPKQQVNLCCLILVFSDLFVEPTYTLQPVLDISLFS